MIARNPASFSAAQSRSAPIAAKSSGRCQTLVVTSG
jgi:hypothetical protein